MYRLTGVGFRVEGRRAHAQASGLVAQASSLLAFSAHCSVLTVQYSLFTVHCSGFTLQPGKKRNSMRRERGLMSGSACSSQRAWPPSQRGRTAVRHASPDRRPERRRTQLGSDLHLAPTIGSEQTRPARLGVTAQDIGLRVRRFGV
eukprot:3798842-Rhodomonas_salina.2